MHFERLVSSEDGRYQEAMALYRQSFPLHEQREEGAQEKALANGAYHFDLLLEGDGLLGILLHWDTPAFIYVEHFCIAGGLRGRGYGQRALAQLDGAGRPVILEIDPPEDDLSRRRRSFYQRAGYWENPFQHIHPPYRPGNQGHRLVVLSRPAPLQPEAYQAFAQYLRQTVMDL